MLFRSRNRRAAPWVDERTDATAQPALHDARDGHLVVRLVRLQCRLCPHLGRGAGPDLASLTDYSPERLVTAILDPNRAVDERYRTYLARSKSGDEWLGILVSQGPNSITIQTADGERHTALRADLQELKMVPSSLMPEGLESVLKPADIADLIAFLGSRPGKD